MDLFLFILYYIAHGSPVAYGDSVWMTYHYIVIVIAGNGKWIIECFVMTVGGEKWYNNPNGVATKVNKRTFEYWI